MTTKRTTPVWAALAVCIVAIGILAIRSSSCSGSAPLGPEVAPEDARRRFDPPGRRTTLEGSDLHTVIGVPSDASETTPEDYLIRRPQYVLSYNQRRGIPNWVAWHLDKSDLGPVPRSDFEPDKSLPKGFYRVLPRDYRGSNFGRGHMCPSADRTSSRDDNEATYVMTNVLPQAEDNNQGPWNDLEMACREIARKGNELYIVAGGSGPFTQLSSNGKIFAPESVWKVVIILAAGDDDLSRVDRSMRVIAVSMPNRNGIREVDWRTYRTSIDAIEESTGLDFFAELPDEIEAELEASVDSQR